MSEIIASTYSVYEEIGAGGGGTVYLAEHLRLNKKVILKADKRKIMARPELLRREVDVLKEFTHSYIPKVYDFFVENDTVYTVMDYIEGESLDKPLKRGERFPAPQVILWAKQLLEALSYLHSPTHGTPPVGYVHSDIKPANLMRTPRNDICLIDFNIAIALGEKNVVGLSIGYASPEHYGLDYSSVPSGASVIDGNVPDADKTVLLSEKNENKTVAAPLKKIMPDVRSDIYMTGATLYHLLSGNRPAKNALEVVPLSKLGVNAQLSEVIAKAMAPNPDIRYQSADEMLYAIEHLHENDARTKRIKIEARITGAVLGAVFAAGIFCAFTGLKRIQTAESALKQVEYSQNALEYGSADEAAAFALQAILESGLFAPKAPAQAWSALSGALGVYDLSDGYNSYKITSLPSAPLYLDISPSGTMGACIYSGNAAVFDTQTSEILTTLPADPSALSEIHFINDSTVIFSAAHGICAYDISADRELWSGEKAMSITVGGKYAAAVYKDANYAIVYDIENGSKRCRIDFGERCQSVGVNDRFINPNDNLLCMNSDGTLLAVSFSDGALLIYNINDPSKDMWVFYDSEFTHFEGGFYEKYFAFSAADANGSVCVIIDCEEDMQTGGFQSEDYYSVKTDKNGIYIQDDNLLVKIDPVTGEQTPLINMYKTLTGYAVGENGALVSAEGGFYFFDGNARQTREYNSGNSVNLLAVAGDTALAASSDSPDIRILKYDSHAGNEVLRYEEYPHDEARISSDGNIMLFSVEGFRIYSEQGELISDTALRDPYDIYDQQFRRGGDGAVLEVTYYNGDVDVYSSESGEIIRTDKIQPPDPSLYEEFFTDHLRIESPLHGTPTAYDIDSGKQVAELESDAYLTYITQSGEYIIAQYVTSGGDYYGVLMNDRCEELARLPYLCDIIGEELVFDYPGSIRRTHIYSPDELRALARN